MTEDISTSAKRKLDDNKATDEKESSLKVQKTESSTVSETPSEVLTDETVISRFSEGLFDQQARDNIRDSISSSGPYKHAIIPELMNDGLLRKVRDEIISTLHFTKKETDIYKVHQTGDLRNLSGLPKDELAKLSSLFDLREALYSKYFRDYLSEVTGCGALSGSKQDLSINVYHKGCQLLTHDDVIGSRRISYILYLPDPDEKWQYPRWGGALRLYPTIKPNVPSKDWSVEIPPAWNQLAFFTVQPGLSFHDVEEVFVDKPRISISGWFHIPQRGEEGFIEGELEETEARSSLKMLESNELQEYDYPKKNYEVCESQEEKLQAAKDRLAAGEESPLDESDFEYLAKYMNPTLLKAPSIKMLSQYFLNESALEIRDFLNKNYASLVKKAIDRVDLNANDEMPKTSKEVEENTTWKLSGPPHKYRYMYLDGRESYDDELTTDKDRALFEHVDSSSKATDADKKLVEVARLLRSPAFRVWLGLVSSFSPFAQRVLARRFRPSYDYTLATTNSGPQSNPLGEAGLENQMVLEGTLCLTPTLGWEAGELGGYELSMMGEDPEATKDLDPAVYRGSSSNTADKGDQNEDDAVLLTCQAEWNVLSLMMRDKEILKFVKYVSGNAPGSRWDLNAEWGVQVDDDDDEDEEEEEEEEQEEKE